MKPIISGWPKVDQRSNNFPMYTVARFNICGAATDELEEVAAKLAVIQDDGTSVPKARKSHVSLSVSTASDWSEHEKAIVAFIQKYQDGIALAKSKGMDVQFDIAIEPEDYQKKTLFGFQLSRGLVDTLAKLQASIDVSLYPATSEQPVESAV